MREWRALRRYLAVPAGNAPIAFDDALIPGVPGRGLLRDWLAQLENKFANDAVDLVAEVQQATFYTPGIFCRQNGNTPSGATFARTPTSPPSSTRRTTLGATKGAKGDTTGGRAPIPVENLVATTNVTNIGYNDPDHWLTVYAISGYQGESGCGSGSQDCEHPSGWPFLWTKVPDNECPSGMQTALGTFRRTSWAARPALTGPGRTGLRARTTGPRVRTAASRTSA